MINDSIELCDIVDRIFNDFEKYKVFFGELSNDEFKRLKMITIFSALLNPLYTYLMKSVPNLI